MPALEIHAQNIFQSDLGVPLSPGIQTEISPHAIVLHRATMTPTPTLTFNKLQEKKTSSLHNPQILRNMANICKKPHHLTTQFSLKQKGHSKGVMMYCHVDPFMACGFYDTAVAPLTACYLLTSRVNRLVNHRHTSSQ